MFKPLLAEKADPAKIKYPCYATPKIDGIRCLLLPQGPSTRTLKPIPNNYIREKLSLPALIGLDGEILTFTEGKRDDFNTVQSKVMRADGAPEFKLIAFDDFTAPQAGYLQRIQSLMADFHELSNDVHPLLPTTIQNKEELDAFEEECVTKHGWEGVMIRSGEGAYKFGRSTVNEGILLKVKRFEDDEAEIIGTVEQMANNNEAVINALGHTERSSSKEGKSGKDTLGALQCLWRGIKFDLGTGFDNATRDELWARRAELIGQKVTFRFQGTGTHGAPRFPTFSGIRSDL